jgi:hypothetical protein
MKMDVSLTKMKVLSVSFWRMLQPGIFDKL